MSFFSSLVFWLAKDTDVLAKLAVMLMVTAGLCLHDVFQWNGLLILASILPQVALLVILYNFWCFPWTRAVLCLLDVFQWNGLLILASIGVFHEHGPVVAEVWMLGTLGHSNGVNTRNAVTKQHKNNLPSNGVNARNTVTKQIYPSNGVNARNTVTK